jgi:hypothetical protein
MLYHFSETSHLKQFVPRPSHANRTAGQEWLNEPLVWAISDQFAFLYLFPRDCPRIATWAVGDTSESDKSHWLGRNKRVAYVEAGWMARLKATRLYRYQLPHTGFEDISDVGMHVSRDVVRPINMTKIDDLPTELEKRDVKLRGMTSLAPLNTLWQTSLHVSGIRLRNASGWV